MGNREGLYLVVKVCLTDLRKHCYAASAVGPDFDSRGKYCCNRTPSQTAASCCTSTEDSCFTGGKKTLGPLTETSARPDYKPVRAARTYFPCNTWRSETWKITVFIGPRGFGYSQTYKLMRNKHTHNVKLVQMKFNKMSFYNYSICVWILVNCCNQTIFIHLLPLL